jgi:hypothetical protein
MFIRKFPQLEEEIKKNLKDNMVDINDGIYVIWGMGVMPSVIRMIDCIADNEKVGSSIFDFFEEMASGGNEELKELLMYSTLETLGDDKIRLSTSRRLMKKETRYLSEKIEAYLGRD